MDLRSVGLPELIAMGLTVFFGYRLLKGSGIGAAVATTALALFGALLGAFVGFLMRPFSPFAGHQLDIDVVLSRGINLKGMDRVLQPMAEQSCNYVLIGAIVGGSLFALARMGMTTKREPLAVATPTGTAPSSGVAFCTKCGKQLGSDMLFCGSCGSPRR
jgi:hypothetical protein